MMVNHKLTNSYAGLYLFFCVLAPVHADGEMPQTAKSGQIMAELALPHEQNCIQQQHGPIPGCTKSLQILGNSGLETDVDPVNDSVVDTDGDGVADTTDLDDDGDGQLDRYEVMCGSDPLSNTSLSADHDGDNLPDCFDLDKDNDGVADC